MDRASSAREPDLLRILDQAFTASVRLAGDWVVCRPGCWQCCVGAFTVSALDAARLRDGLHALEGDDPARAARVRSRAQAWVERQSAAFPGDPATGLLHTSDEARARFDDFANDEPCPALDPDTRTCDLYTARPFTCRVFGPPIRTGDDAIGICELCFDGASDEEIAACVVDTPAAALDAELSSGLGGGETVVAWVLR